ncbi:T9SS type A sorting domain-containing protein, partial [bacterium]|nr:T9SS type A sorting domain-containing protein [bacterium]
ENFDRTLMSVVDLPRLCRKLFWNDRHLLASLGNELFAYNLFDPSVPVVDSIINLPLSIVEITFANDQLYAIGPEGIAVFDIDGEFPELLAFGGDGGSIITVWGDIVAASDGGSVKTYQTYNRGEENKPVILPTGFTLKQNYPNPFNNRTTIPFSLSQDAHVTITIYNVLGRQVITLISEQLNKGSYNVSWDGTNKQNNPVASGIYLYRMQAGDVTELRKMVLVK